MRLVNDAGRAALLDGFEVFDIHTMSDGRLPADPGATFAEWERIVTLAERGSYTGGQRMVPERLGPPQPRPPSIFAIGFNYRDHAVEADAEPVTFPPVFTKFPSCLTGPFSEIVMPADPAQVDWEIELAFVIAHGGRKISRERALDHIAGFTIAQDISERMLQLSTGGHYSMGKSYDTFCPLGPALVTVDELEDPGDLVLTCRVNGEVKQRATTAALIYDVPSLVEQISGVVTLRPGDLVLTGTPSGIGYFQEPQQFLRPGDVVESEIDGLGAMRNTCVADVCRNE